MSTRKSTKDRAIEQPDNQFCLLRGQWFRGQPLTSILFLRIFYQLLLFSEAYGTGYISGRDRLGDWVRSEEPSAEALQGPQFALGGIFGGLDAFRFRVSLLVPPFNISGMRYSKRSGAEEALAGL